MNKKIWDIYAPIYEKAMRGDRKAYGMMYERIPQVIQGMDVLEVATGSGLPDPQKALWEIDRVLKEDGLLIAPNFVDHKKGAVSVIWSKILSVAGVKFEHQWSANEYRGFLEANGWEVMKMEEMTARFTLAYVECVKRTKLAGAARYGL